MLKQILIKYIYFLRGIYPNVVSQIGNTREYHFIEIQQKQNNSFDNIK